MMARLPGLVWVVLTLVVLDQLTKVWVHATLGLYDSITVIPGLLNLVHVRNEGVAFGLLNDLDLPYKPLLTIGLACLALVGMVFYYRQLQPHERLARLGVAFIAGGAIGNLIDRVQQGYVLDFVDAYRGDWHFWAFNVADAAISIGVVCLLLDVLGVGRRASHPV